MCRLFGLTAGASGSGQRSGCSMRPTPWLCRATATSMGAASGSLTPPAPVLDKQPEPSFEDAEFIHEAKAAESTAFVAHVRWASAGGRTVRNTHPFAMHGRIMAHNGGFGELPRLEEQLGPYASLVLGDTDS